MQGCNMQTRDRNQPEEWCEWIVLRASNGVGNQHIEHEKAAHQLNECRRIAGEFDIAAYRHRQPALAGRQSACEQDTEKQA